MQDDITQEANVMGKSFSKADVAELLAAAGLDLSEVQARAGSNLQAIVQVSDGLIESSQRTISELQEDIRLAKVDKSKAESTLKVVKLLV
jgi:hypothetical protein